ncbi:ParB/RepB/Spo0J family partition protein [Hominenteromicrobium sp.]|uniref:ParB/RepB/Spo0J family partition protein n=1 Tax=Hominenteromicrobium sp. TaxID=3073581 RepID=UPI003A8FBD6E
MAKKGGLGKGLDAIFYDNAREDDAGAVELGINDLEPNRTQPRQSFDDGAMTELADSIAQHGVLQPILVRPLLSGGYQIVAGERRWRASRMAGLTTVPAVIRDLTDSEVMQLALIENLQREDLKPLEEANGYKMLMDNFEFTQEEIAKTVGKSRPAITNALRLLNLPEDMQNMLERGEMTAGHARTLLSFKNEDQMKAAARRVTMEGISVRELEKMAKRANEEKPEKADKPAKRRIRYYDEAELALRDVLNRVVHISGTKKKAALTIEFYGEEDLKNLLYDLKLTDKTDE